MTTSYLLFKLYESLYGIDIDFVHEIIELPELKYVAEMPSHLAGLLNLHGEIIKVLDLGACLSYPPKHYSLNDLIIVVKGPDFFFGVIVCQVLDIKHLFDMTSIKSQTSEEEAFPLSLLSQVSKYEEQIVFILDPHLLIKKAEILKEILPSQKHLLESDRNVPIDPKDQLTFSVRAQNLMRPLTNTGKTESLTSLTVVILEQEYFGIDPNIIKEFFPIGEFTPIPHAPPYLLGFINFRGNILTLVDICPILKMQKLKVTPHSQVLIVDLNNIWVGIVVDKVMDLIYLKSADFQAIPIEIEETVAKEFTRHTVFYEKNILGVLDMDKILESITK